MSDEAQKLPEVRFLDVVKPAISTGEALGLLQAQYGIRGELHPLDSERDLNFRVTLECGTRYLFKISNHAEPASTVDFEIAALAHVAATDPGLPVPRIVRTGAGRTRGAATAADGTTHILRLLSYLPGTVIAESARTDALACDVGRTAARMARALQGFFHPAAGNRRLLWDIRELGSLQPVIDEIEEPGSRAFIAGIVDHFMVTVKPQLARLRAQVAHMDLNDHNLVVDAQAPATVSGILDFGDMHHGPLLQDVTIAMANVMHPDDRPSEKAHAFLRGYQHVLPLDPGEIALLYDALLAYFALYFLILTRRGDSYATGDSGSVLALLRRLHSEGREAFTDRAEQACGRPRPRGIPPGDVAALVARRLDAMGRPMYVFYDPPLNLVAGEGVWLRDSSGKTYLDAYNNVPIAGHAHPYVTQAIARQSARLNTNTRYLCDEIIAYAERLTALLPEGLDNACFVNSGSEANDLAWLMAKAYTGNQGAIVIEDAYHGWTAAVDALSPSNKPRAPLAAHVRTVAAPDRYRQPHADTHALLAHYAQCVDAAIASLAQSGLQPALCIVDAAFCSSGIPALLPGYLAMLFDKVRRAGGLCVADEVQSGFGRMGHRMWGFEVQGAQPDIVTVGKPMANGYPMGAVVTRPDILAAGSAGGAVFATFGGNNVAAAAASAVLDVYEHDGLLENSTDVGRYLGSGLMALAERHALIGDVRGSGLMLGVELVLDRTLKTPAAAATTRLLQLLADSGVLAGSDGPHGNVLKIRPPLVFARDHAGILLERLDRGLAAL